MIESNPSSDLGWKLLLLLPRMLLQLHVQGGKVGHKEVKCRYQRFLSYHWEELIHFKNPVRRKPQTTQPVEHQRRKITMRLVQSGEIARAARALTSQGLAPAKSEVLEKLKLKRPVGHINSSDIPDIPDSVETIQLDKATFIKVLKNAPRSSGCGPIGWRYEHVRVLLDNVITSDLLYLVCNNIASGEIPSKIIPLLSAATLIALPKHGSDVRPIAIGKVFRWLTAKAICQQKSLDFADPHCNMALPPLEE